MKRGEAPINYEQMQRIAKAFSGYLIRDRITGDSRDEAARAFRHFRDAEHLRYDIVIHKYDLSQNLGRLNFGEARENLVELLDLTKRRRNLNREIKDNIDNSSEYGLFAVGLQQLMQKIANMKMPSPEIQCIRQNVIYSLRDELLQPADSES